MHLAQMASLCWGIAYTIRVYTHILDEMVRVRLDYGESKSSGSGIWLSVCSKREQWDNS